MSKQLASNRNSMGTLLVAALVVAFGFTNAAEAGSRHALFGNMDRIAEGPVIPPEWAGIWTYTDSVFSCTGILDFVETGNDTLCAGAILGDSGEGPVSDVICDGSADATTVSLNCSGSTEVLPDCMADFSSTTTGTRTGETYKAVAQYQLSFSGGALGCSSFPGFCETVRTSATRIAPQPAECSTAVNQADWGLVKQLYK